MHRFLEHTADAYLEAKARTFPEAVKDAMEGTFELVGRGTVENAQVDISAAAEDLPMLVVRLLERAVIECELEKISPTRAEILEADEGRKRISARIHGERRPPKNIIKAVTYHRLEVKKERGEWAIRVLFDV